jgi:hypothetical protein
VTEYDRWVERSVAGETRMVRVFGEDWTDPFRDRSPWEAERGTWEAAESISSIDDLDDPLDL